MKSYIHDTRKSLDIEIILEYVPSEVTATQLIRHPSNLKCKKRIDDLKLQILSDVTMSIMSCIQFKEHLVLTRPYHVKHAPKYYIDFDVIDEEGKVVLPVGIKLHSSAYIKNKLDLLDTHNTISSSFVLNDINYENSVELISTISNICDELDKRNIEVLDTYVS